MDLRLIFSARSLNFRRMFMAGSSLQWSLTAPFVAFLHLNRTLAFPSSL